MSDTHDLPDPADPVYTDAQPEPGAEFREALAGMHAVMRDVVAPVLDDIRARVEALRAAHPDVFPDPDTTDDPHHTEGN